MVGLNQVLVAFLDVEQPCLSDLHEGGSQQFLLQHDVRHLLHHLGNTLQRLLGRLNRLLRSHLLHVELSSLYLHLLVPIMPFLQPFLTHFATLLWFLLVPALFIVHCDGSKDRGRKYSSIFFYFFSLNRQNSPNIPWMSL